MNNKQKAIEQVVSAVKKLSLEDNSEGNAVKSDVRKLEDAKANDNQKDTLSQLTKSLIAYEEKLASKNASKLNYCNSKSMPNCSNNKSN